MFIEIHGAGFSNKGAELMLGTLVTELQRRIPGVLCCRRPEAPYPQMCEYGLLPILTFGSRHAEGGFYHWRGELISRLISRRQLRRHNLVRADEVDAFLDISGYAFGDKIEIRYLQRLEAKAAAYARRGKPVLLLPQMFGPFEKPGYRDAFRSAMRCVDVAYARERVSHACAAAAMDDPSRLKLAPDITIFAEPTPNDFAGVPENPFACIVPNQRMVTVGAAEWGGKYLDLLLGAAREILRQDLDVLLIIHETSGADEELARQVAAVLDAGSRVRIVNEPQPLRLKALFWKSRLLVSSRYHGIVSALSGGTPSILLGWAHKYEELAADFGVTECVFHASDPPERMIELTRALLMDDPAMRRKCLGERKQLLRHQNESMWMDIVKRLNVAATGQN